MDFLTMVKMANRERAKDFPDYQMFVNGDILYYSNALAGEVGELCNIVKKFKRGDKESHGMPIHRCMDDEIADVFLQLDLLCQVAGVNLIDAVRSKFNSKSAAIGSKIWL